MRHFSEDELILFHYGEGRRRDRIDDHLKACAPCAAISRDIARMLDVIPDLDVPERDDRYGLEVWQRIRHHLPVQEAPWWMAWYRPAAACGVAVLIVAAFVAGRYWPTSDAPPAPPPLARDVAPDASDRVRLAAIGDHLEQSERVLLDLLNAGGGRVDVTVQQAWASDLIDSNRLYRHEAERAGEDAVAGVLDELERQLLEIVHGPSTLTARELNAMRARLDAAALLFKVRVLSDELRERELVPIQPRKTT
jgi:hypothetical protein